MECSELKEKLYNCLKDKELGYDSRFLKIPVKRRYEDIKLFKIDPKILEECKHREFTDCLEKKFEMEKYDHRKLYRYYEEKYYKEKTNKDNISRLQHKIFPGDMKKEK
jgi:hypothetical protein